MLNYDDIVKYPEDILRKKCKKVDIEKDQYELATVIQEMQDYLDNSYDEEFANKNNIRAGVGLAANQINKDMAIFAIDCMDSNDERYINHFINPEIIKTSKDLIYLEDGEGCLSFEGEANGLTMRHKWIVVKYYDIENNLHEERFEDYLSIIFQHEFDHLQGKMFFDNFNLFDPWKPAEDAKPI